MGLDVYHYKLTHEPSDLEDYILVGDWEQKCNVPFEKYQGYKQQKCIRKLVDSITIFKTEADKRRYLEIPIFIFDPDDLMLVEERETDLAGTIDSLIKKHGLQGYIQDDYVSRIDNISTRIISFEKDLLQDVVYYEECGYQRKGMGGIFFDYFKKYEYFGKREDFEVANSCVNGAWYGYTPESQGLKELRLEFKEQFVDTYEYGRSLLHACF